jgi:hypothetical protein
MSDEGGMMSDEGGMMSVVVAKAILVTGWLLFFC